MIPIIILIFLIIAHIIIAFWSAHMYEDELRKTIIAINTFITFFICFFLFIVVNHETGITTKEKTQKELLFTANPYSYEFTYKQVNDSFIIIDTCYILETPNN